MKKTKNKNIRIPYLGNLYFDVRFISKETPLMTHVIAETCLNNANIVLTKELVNGLVARANFHFSTNEHFRKKCLSKKGNQSRDYLYMFIEHWIKAEYWNKLGILPEHYKDFQEEIQDSVQYDLPTKFPEQPVPEGLRYITFN